VTAVDLRFEVTRLSDTELAARLDEAWQQFEVADKKQRWPRWSGLHLLSGVWWLDLLIVVGLSDKVAGKFVRITDARTDAALGKVQDMINEVERRVAARQAKAS
jgi:hypothetical protein